MNWVPKERTIFSVVECAWNFQTSNPDIFQQGKVEVDPALRNLILKVTGAKIALREDANLRLPGYLLKKRGIAEYDIVLSRSITYCWKRFTLVKELCHILTDDGSVYAKNATEQIAHALVMRNAFNAIAALNSEEFCFLLAIELLIPLQRRTEIQAKIKAGETDFNIANSLKIPEWIIHFYYKRTPFSNTTDAIRLAFDYHMVDAPPAVQE